MYACGSREKKTLLTGLIWYSRRSSCHFPPKYQHEDSWAPWYSMFMLVLHANIHNPIYWHQKEHFLDNMLIQHKCTLHQRTSCQNENVWSTETKKMTEHTANAKEAHLKKLGINVKSVSFLVSISVRIKFPIPLFSSSPILSCGDDDVLLVCLYSCSLLSDS